MIALIFFAVTDGTQIDGVGSPAWFSWADFCQGAAAGAIIVGPMFVYWMMKRAADESLR